MSNIIKSNYIFYNSSDKVLINSDEKIDGFNSLSLMNFAQCSEDSNVISDHKEDEKEEKEEKEEIVQSILQEEAELKAQEIINNAKAEAEQILLEAGKKAGKMEECALAKGMEEGHKQGLKQAELECELKKQEIEQLKVQLKGEYESQLRELEPKFADLTMKLVKKMTGIIADDKKELILYQISEAVRQVKGSKRFIIRVSKEDTLFVAQKKEELLDILGSGCSLEVLEDSSLQKNQCFIETEDRLLDVSLDTELKSLEEHFKILACS